MRQDTTGWPVWAALGYDQGYPVGWNNGWNKASQGASQNYSGQPDTNPASYGFSMPEPYVAPESHWGEAAPSQGSGGTSDRDYAGGAYSPATQWRDNWSKGFLEGFFDGFNAWFAQTQGPSQTFEPPKDSSAVPFDPTKPVPGGKGWPIPIPKPGGPSGTFFPGKYGFGSGSGGGSGSFPKVTIPGGAGGQTVFDPGRPIAVPGYEPPHRADTETGNQKAKTNSAIWWVLGLSALAVGGYFVLRDEPAAPSVWSPNPARRGKRYHVLLTHAPNPDVWHHGYGGYWSPMRRPGPEIREVSSLAEASKAALDYIDKYELGGGNWGIDSGLIVEVPGDRVVGQVAYNGRVFEPGPWKSVLYEPK